MPTDIGISHVKAHSAEILRRVASGESFTITRRDVPMADIVLLVRGRQKKKESKPSKSSETSPELKASVEMRSCLGSTKAENIDSALPMPARRISIVPTEIGSFEVKTRLAEILRKVEQGESFSITRRGKIIAQLNPPAPSFKPVPQDVIDRLMHPRIHGISGDEVLAAIREGRK